MTTISYHRDGVLRHKHQLTPTEAEAERQRILAEMASPALLRAEMAHRRRKCSPCGSQDPNLGDG